MVLLASVMAALAFMGFGFLLAVACCRGGGEYGVNSIFGGSAKTRTGPVGAAFDPNDRLKRVSSLNSVWHAVDGEGGGGGKKRGHKRSDSIDTALIRSITQSRSTAGNQPRAAETKMRPRLDST